MYIYKELRWRGMTLQIMVDQKQMRNSRQLFQWKKIDVIIGFICEWALMMWRLLYIIGMRI